MKIEITIKTSIKPSENQEKIEQAVKNLFPEIEIEKNDYLIGKGSGLDCLENLKNKLGLQSIRDSARRELKKGKKGEEIKFLLNKQAATVDKINFTNGEAPLGPIEVSIKSNDPESLIDYLAPSQKERK